MSLTELLARVEAATGPDRELDAAIADFSMPRTDGQMHWPFVDGSPTDRKLPRYTSSIDAAVSLCDRVLPGWAWMARKGVSPQPDFGVAYVHAPDEESFISCARTPSLALCAAIIKAILEKDK